MATRNIEATLNDLRGRIDQIQSELLSQANAAGKAIAKEGPSLVEQATDAAQDAAANGADRVHELAAAGRRLWGAAESGIGDARENIRVAAAKTRNAVVEVASSADQGSRQALGTVRSFVKERPVASLLIAVAAGLVVGRALDRD